MYSTSNSSNPNIRTGGFSNPNDRLVIDNDYSDGGSSPSTTNYARPFRGDNNPYSMYTDPLNNPFRQNIDDEPGSPNGDNHSNESNSSGTRVDSRSPSAFRGATGGNIGSTSKNNSRMDVIGNDGIESGNGVGGLRDSGNGLSEASHMYSENGFQGQFGRNRANSYGDGLNSARASTIGTEHMMGGLGGLPKNNSRVALNSDWRGSSEGSDFHHRQKQEYYDQDLNIAGGENVRGYNPLPPPSPAPENEKGTPEKTAEILVDKAPAPVIISRANRMDWIDGLRGIASLVIFTHHFMDLTWSQSHPDALSDGSFYGTLANGQLAVGMYFLLGGRVLAHGFYRSAFTKPKPLKDHGEIIPNQPPLKPPQPRWMSLASSLFRRSIRLAFPALVVGTIQWIVCKAGWVTHAPQEANEKVLAPTDLWTPTWCAIGDFWGLLTFWLDLFTNRNHQYMLYVGSALWTTYDQFWGSILVYIVAATFAPLPPRGRYLCYVLIFISLWWYNSSNLLYMYGLFLADLNASGYIRKIQDNWIPTVAIEASVMALALAMMAGGTYVATPANVAMSRITVYNGQFGWDQSYVWPQYMLISNWLPVVCILTWVEFSHAMQWFTSWGIFTWIGKVSYGFYLMQFLTLYGIMPHLILAFGEDGSRSYWNIVIPTYVVSLLCNFFLAWVSYHALDRTGLKLAKWIWDGFFVSKPNNAAALPMKMVRAFGLFIINTPGEIIRDTGKSISSKATGTKKFLHTLFNWRTPTIRDPVPDPTDPDILAQLHSTRWTSDLSHDAEAMRTAKLLWYQQYAWLIHIWLIPGIAGCWLYFHPTGPWTWDAITFSVLWRFIWVLSVPNCLFAYVGFCTPDWLPSQKELEKKPVKREYIRNFFVLLVTKGSNESAVRRGYNKLIKLEKYHPAVKVVVLTDEPYAYPDLQNIVCPKSYVSPLGKAKYKARALDYFRFHVSLGVYDWILHMDEESVTDAETIRRCMEFIRYTPHAFGQGIILYNGEGFWNNWYFTVADGIRVGDDLARFHFQNTVIQRPVFGVHGSFLMTNGEMENECTWDFGSLAEDFEFSQDAWRRGFTCGRIHGIVREQSPTSLRDFLKQRRRWFMGIRDIKGMYGLPHFAINLWIIGVFTLSVTIINLFFALVDDSLTPFWIALCADFCFITFYSLYLWGLLFQELDYGQKWWKIIIHLTCSIVIQPFASVAEGLSAIWAMSSEDFGKFEVIVKK